MTKSLPLWERGLKSRYSCLYDFGFTSLPLWERGLKSFDVLFNGNRKQVAPLVGAWIEIDK